MARPLSRRSMIGVVAAVAVAGAVTGVVRLLPSGDEPKTGEPQVRYGEEDCEHCGMLISDSRFAAVWRTHAGSEMHFDDVGCMIAMIRHMGGIGGSELFVRSFDDSGWLDARVASYIHADGIASPMGYNIAALADPDREAALVSGDGTRVQTWDRLLVELEERS